MSKPQHVYLIGYLHEKGHGRAILHRDHPILSVSDLLFAESQLAAESGFTCSIFTYQLIEVTR